MRVHAGRVYAPGAPECRVAIPEGAAVVPMREGPRRRSRPATSLRRIGPSRAVFSPILPAIAMRKSIIPDASDPTPAEEDAWLDVATLARVEITSEDASHPIEGALVPGGGSGWRAARAGPQTLRLLFDSPRELSRIRLRFVETAAERQQEFVLRWSADGSEFHEIVRQQWNFSPDGATSEIEDYRVQLASVAVLELTIRPDVGGGGAPASLAELRLA